MDKTVSRPDASPNPEHESSTRLSQEANAKQSWTVAIDLSANMRDEHGKPDGAGAPYKWGQLQKLAADTVGKPVTLVVSVTEPDENSKDKNVAKPKPTSAQIDADPFTTQILHLKHPTVDTYTIREGKVTKVETHKSQGTAQDVDALLKLANSQAPAEHRALIVFGHGSGTAFEAIQGDAGIAPISYVRAAIKDGMPKETPLDLTVFDSCTMASVGTLHAMQGLTDRVVASADTEYAPGRGLPEGINLNATLKNLLDNPNMSGKDLSADFINEAKKGSDGTPGKVTWDPNHLRAQIDTLAAFDLSKYQQFQTSLDNFGTALNKGIDAQSSKDAVAAVVDGSATMPSYLPSYEGLGRDLDQFTTKVLKGIADGKIADDGSIKAAAESLLGNQAQMTEGYYGSSNYYQQLGGLTIDLPPAGKEARFKQAASQTTVGQLVDISNVLPVLASRSKLHYAVEQTIDRLAEFKDPTVTNDLSGMKKAEHAIAAAKSQKGYDGARTELKTSIDDYLATGLGKRTIENIVEMRDRASKTAGKPWAAFVDKLGGLDPELDFEYPSDQNQK